MEQAATGAGESEFQERRRASNRRMKERRARRGVSLAQPVPVNRCDAATAAGVAGVVAAVVASVYEGHMVSTSRRVQGPGESLRLQLDL